MSSREMMPAKYNDVLAAARAAANMVASSAIARTEAITIKEFAIGSTRKSPEGGSSTDYDLVKLQNGRSSVFESIDALAL